MKNLKLPHAGYGFIMKCPPNGRLRCVSPCLGLEMWTMKTGGRTFRHLFAAFFAAALICPAGASGGVILTPIAVDGLPVPGVPERVFGPQPSLRRPFAPPNVWVSPAGDFAYTFSTQLSDDSLENRLPSHILGLGSAASGELSLLFGADRVVEGLGYTSGTILGINRAGDVLLRSVLFNPASPGSLLVEGRVLVGRDRAPAVLVRRDESTPGVPGVEGDLTFDLIDDALLTDSGRLMFIGQLPMGGEITRRNQHGVWTAGEAGVERLLVRTGDPAPGGPEGSVFHGDDYASLLFLRAHTDDGQALVAGSIDEKPIGIGGLWRVDGLNPPVPLLLTKQPAALLGEEAILTGLRSASIVDRPSAASVRVELSIPDGSDQAVSQQRLGIVSMAGDFQELMRTGQEAAGLEGGIISGFSFDSHVQVSETGFSVFTALQEGGATDVPWGPPWGAGTLWARSPQGELRLIAQGGRIAPGVPRTSPWFPDDTAPAVFWERAFDDRSGFGTGRPSLDVNTHGDVVFSDWISHTLGITVFPRQGIWYYNWELDEVFLVAVAEEYLEVAPGDSRRIQELSLIEGRSLTDAGEVFFGVRFYDGTSGVFMATMPEPGTLALVMAGGLVAGRRKRRRFTAAW